jgi:hypothetical protein
MYWIVGWLPGGSAGTSFCKGTEMSISRRAMAVPLQMRGNSARVDASLQFGVGLQATN